MKVNRKSCPDSHFGADPGTGTWTNSSSNQSQSVSSTNGCCSLNMHFFFPPLSSNVEGAWHLRPTFQSFTLKKGFGCPLIVANSYNFIIITCVEIIQRKHPRFISNVTGLNVCHIMKGKVTLNLELSTIALFFLF